jgi:hypothetical protein
MTSEGRRGPTALNEPPPVSQSSWPGAFPLTVGSVPVASSRTGAYSAALAPPWITGVPTGTFGPRLQALLASAQTAGQSKSPAFPARRANPRVIYKIRPQIRLLSFYIRREEIRVMNSRTVLPFFRGRCPRYPARASSFDAPGGRFAMRCLVFTLASLALARIFHRRCAS